MRLNILLLIMLVSACTHRSMKNEAVSNQNGLLKPDSIYLEGSIKAAVDSIELYHHTALKTLALEDTFGARVYYEEAFEIVNSFDPATSSVLQEWFAYDSLLSLMTIEYENIYSFDVFNTEAEEVREDIFSIDDETDEIEIDSTMYVDTSFAVIPLDVSHSRVQKALTYFQGRGRKVFTIWLERTGKYEGLVKNILREEGVPEDLFYLAMIESGLRPTARSYAKASGMWQFIYATGHYYGLRSNYWFDERRDPILSTRAAARHLRDLYDRFGDWYLALAGYNCNPNRIAANMRRYNTNSYWELIKWRRNGRNLPRQTRQYVPIYIAAATIAKDPKKYGFYVERHEPVVYDTVTLSECVDLEIIAKCVDSDFNTLKELNPAVQRWCTPPGVTDFVLNLPKDSKVMFWENYSKVPDDKKRSYVRHKIKKGETLSTIANKYSTSTSVIKSHNRLKGTVIHSGDYLIIPVPQNKNFYQKYSYTKPSKKRQSSSPAYVSNVPGHKKIIYRVKSGNTLGEISEIYSTRAANIRKWNGLYYGQHIYPDQKLNIWIPDNRPEPLVKSTQVTTFSGSYEEYVVKKDDTLWEIAQIFKVKVEEIKYWNNKTSNTIKPGEHLKIAKSKSTI
jgi:membrane-bound lytic murein transglycosylase D